ncbi:major fimbriae structural protein Flp [Pontimonas salivibrio]|uniref:Major fimbriae structural protein Flp n=1 Tax=Pontimonas salivibrio TaxID=1159327 RepID=A0A2L2BP18_9MICO|nr:major fimbriae structural protein Flp [Pontimonas salivibrio]
MVTLLCLSGLTVCASYQAVTSAGEERNDTVNEPESAQGKAQNSPGDTEQSSEHNAQHVEDLGRGPRADEGAATAEYAIATMAAVGFAGLLVVIMQSDEVREILTDLVRSALSFTA